MSDQIDAGLASGLTYDEDTISAIVAAVHRALSELPALQARAEVAAADWRERCSGSAFIERLFQWAEVPARRPRPPEGAVPAAAEAPAEPTPPR